MNKKLLAVLVIVCGIFVIAGIVYVIFWNDGEIPGLRDNSPVSEQDDADREYNNQFPVGTVKQEIKTIMHRETDQDTDRVGKSDLERIAGSFAERFGSYSNQSNFNNISDLKIFMSQRMKNWSDQYITEIREGMAPNEIYYGITTKAVYKETLDFDDDVGESRILVKTQRREATGVMSNASTFYQDIVISFVRTGEAWQVDSANWQEAGLSRGR